MSYMYGGAILHVDLSGGEISKEPTASYSGAFLGGRGVNIRILYNGPAGIDPLDPASSIIFGVGPLCGTPVPASRTAVTAKSPETGLLGISNFGGDFGPELKFAGYDHVVVKGKADRPTYLCIDNNRVEIRDASSLWGRDTYETLAILRAKVGAQAKVVCIGPAGENKVRFATVQHKLGHAGGRTGMGAVMGSKNLKAIVVRGTRGIELADQAKYLSIATELQQELREHPRLREIRQIGLTKNEDRNRHLHFADPDWEPAAQAHDLYLKYKPRRAGCFGCLQQCKDYYPAEAKGGGVISCALNILPLHGLRTKDVDLLLECSLSMQRYGVDVVTSIAIISWLMRLYEKGVITAKDTDGIPMEWGSRHAVLDILRKIVYREGFGDVLADGILPAAKRIGRGSGDYAYQVKGLPMWPPRIPDNLVPRKGVALAMAVSRGDATKAHLAHEMNLIKLDDMQRSDREKFKQIAGTEKAATPGEYEGKPEVVAYFEDSATIDDCLSACKVLDNHLIGPALLREKYIPALLSAGTGVETSEDMLFRVARRVRNLERAYEAREGLTREADALPNGCLDRRVGWGVSKGEVLESDKFEEMKSRYYVLRGWDAATGIPTKETLEQSGLGDVAQDLEARGMLARQSSASQSKD